MLTFGNTAVPWTVSWTGEDAFRVDRCRFSARLAICQADAPGVGKPLFGKPHWQRQRHAIAECRCDLCGKPLKLATKVSLSHARPVGHGADGLAILKDETLPTALQDRAMSLVVNGIEQSAAAYVASGEAEKRPLIAFENIAGRDSEGSGRGWDDALILPRETAIAMMHWLAQRAEDELMNMGVTL